VSNPSLVVEVAFATDPADTPTWVDVSDRLRGFATSRGRQHELDRFEAGTAAVVLDNFDRALDPTNVDSPLYPGVLPSRRVRISFGGVPTREIRGFTEAISTYTTTIADAVGEASAAVFSGFADGWPQSWSDGGVDAVVDLRASDGFKVLALATVGGTFPEQRTDERVAALLDAAEWPAADRDIETGQSDIQEVLLAQSSALSNLQETEATENGRLFMTAAGRVRFIDRHTPLLDPSSLATFGDVDGELPYVDLALSYDDANIWNRIRVAREGGTTQQADGLASQARHFRRTLRIETLITSDDEAADAANWLLLRYQDAQLRADELVVDPSTDAALWPLLTVLDLGDRVTVRKRPLGGGDPIERDVVVEGIAWRYDLTSFEWRARLSPADTTDVWAVWDEARWDESAWAY
jgi:hypothetical protein